MSAHDFPDDRPKKKRLHSCGALDWLVVPGRGYRLRYPEKEIQFDLTRIRHDDGATTGLLSVRVGMRDAYRIGDGLISSADFNCSVLRTRKERANHLADRSNAEELDWFGALEELCLRVLAAEEQGDPAVVLEDLPGDAEAFADLDAGGLPLVQRQPTMWFGDGGAAKSYLALYAAVNLAQNGQHVLYCDWEFDGLEHKHRLQQLVGPRPGLRTLWYLRCSRPLVREIERVQAMVGQHHITALICDSAGFAALGPPEASEAALGYFGALRTLGPITSLHIAHMTKGDQGDQKPFGSAFWHNGARSTWYLKRSDSTSDTAPVNVAFYHRKANTGRLQPARGMQLEFLAHETRIRPTSLEDPELVAKLPLLQRLDSALKSGALKPDALAEAAETSQAAIRVYMQRHPDKLVRLEDGRIGRGAK